MDKFIVRRCRSPQERRSTKSKPSRLRQSTIKSLPRVVVIEDILHLKTSLEAHKNDTDESKLLEILEELKSMNPSTQILKDTKIGRTVNKFRKSEHPSVSQLSRLIVKNWKKLVLDENTQKESIDVRCDAKTEMLRCKARKMICDGLNTSMPNPWTEALEKKLFEECQRRITNKYKRSVRSIVFFVKIDKTLQDRVKQATITPEEILSRCLYTEGKK